MLMRANSAAFVALLLALAGLVAPSAASAQSLAGLWDASVVVNKLEIPVPVRDRRRGRRVKGSFFNGDEKVTSTSGSLENGTLTLAFDEYGSKVIATVKDGRARGRVQPRDARRAVSVQGQAVHASRCR
jgi:hypothetical protein